MILIPYILIQKNIQIPQYLNAALNTPETNNPGKPGIASDNSITKYGNN